MSERNIHIASQNGGFSWIENAVAKQIKDSCGGGCLLVYVGLCLISSQEKGRATFRASRARISDVCGLSSRSVFDRLKELKEAGFIESEESQDNSRIPNQYTLLRPPMNALHI